MNPSLELGPILRSLRHHKGAFSLLVLEVALGFVMLTHTLIMARYYYRLQIQPTGLLEEELVVARRRFVRPRELQAARSVARADLAALAGTGARAAALDAPPLPDAAAFPTVLTQPGDAHERLAWLVRASPGIVPALGLQLIAGTGFDDSDHSRGLSPTLPLPDGAAPVLLTATAAKHLYGTIDDAVGKPVVGSTFGRGRVAGVVRDLAFRGTWLPDACSFVFVAAEPTTEHESVYVLRAPDRPRKAVVDAAARALAGTGDADSVTVVEPLKREAARFVVISEGAVIIALWTGFLMVAVALAGSLALASFSVTERTRQIGVRRALGATRGEIIRYFLFENLLLTAFGLGLGLALAIGLNHVLRRIMSELRLGPEEVLLSMAIFIGTGLLSTLVPARRAAAIPPWAATRTL